MRKLKLLIGGVATLLLGGVNSVYAYTVEDLKSAGWTMVTDLSSLNISDNYFMLVDARTSKYSVTNARPGTDSKPTYQTIQNPIADWAQVWKISKDASAFFIQSVVDNWYFISAANSGEGWTDKMSAESTNGGFQISLTEGKYTIKGVFSNGYVGPWNNDGAVSLSNKLHWNTLEDNYYEELACNKSEDQSPDFYIYCIARATYDAARRGSATLETEGWDKVTAADGLGKAGYYYTFLDLSETGYETGLAMIGTNGRPQYTSLAEPFANTTQLWTTEAHGNGYALKNLGVDKYLYLASADTWNTSFTSDVNTSYTDFVATVSDGKWTLSNSLNTSEFVGRWTNSPYAPGKDEEIAANKAADNGKRMFFIYSIPTLAGVATELPSSGNMAADTWYYFDINTTASSFEVTATTLSNIVYTTDGSVLAKNGSSVTSQFTVTDNSISATRYYVKSSSVNNLRIDIVYSYSVSEASSDVSYVQEGKTVTVSYTVRSNNPNASLTQDYSGVTFGGNAVSVTPTASGFTFTVPEVAANTEYILAIPAGAIKYNEGVKNAAQNITLKTPAVFDGIYYFYNTDTHKYMSRGNTWGTQAITDDYGLPAYLAFDGEGKTKVKFFDNYKFLSDGDWLYADNDTGGTFFVEAASGGYKFKDATSSKYVAIYNGVIVGDAVEGDNLQGSSNVWALETPAQYKAKDNATTLANAQAAAAATAAGMGGITTLAALESELAANYLESPITITGAKAEQYNQNAGGGDGGVLKEKVYVNETVSSLQPGLYRLTVDAFQRASSNARTAAADGARSLVYVYAGSAKTQLKSVMEYGADAAYASDYENGGKHYPNNEASGYAALETGNYKNSVYVYVADAGEGTGSLTFGINNPQNSNAGDDYAVWAIYENFSLTRFDAKATTAEKQALDDAISNAEANLGFEDGEYAPYNNLEAFAKLDAAKAIDKETALGTEVVAATTALNGAWNANVGEVNAFYGGDFTQYETKDKKDYPYGWNLYNGADNHSRIMGGSEGTNNTGLSASSSGKALLLKYNATYGESEGYTMPLKAGKIYKITFKHGRWNEANPRLTDVVMTDPNGESITLAPAFQAKNNGCESNAENWETYTGYFVSTTAGNYKFNLTKQGGTSQMQIGIADIDLRTASELEFADGAVPTYAPGTYPSVKITRNLTAGRWATAVYPFAVSGVDDIAVLDSYDASTGVLGFKSATASTANVPFLMRSTAGATAITVSNVDVAAAAATDDIASAASLKGTYTQMTVDAGEGVYNYVLSNNMIYKVGQNAATINPYRAYIQLTQPDGARALSFFIDSDTTTGIDGLTAEDAKSGQVFSLSGQRVKSPRKGLYIMNGRKVFVK